MLKISKILYKSRSATKKSLPEMYTKINCLHPLEKFIKQLDSLLSLFQINKSADILSPIFKPSRLT
jgi:hypothetical protein